ncbi:OmpA family protein [Salisediminibacterium beveridgei]|uniref:Putative periplasmic protein n=1 Tax=Salisediminibacterium beveridgei TaxID=632773 RepID=A0A1D7QX40_9BACI|nr:OmpA family protein [Salisediminibacterium beveridgei]AOM83539.1 Putative periplasmic protein [Salisediminibacterium beveridgei]
MARGYRNKRRFSQGSGEEDKSSFWMSYSDLMSALLLMFALFLTVSIMDNQSSIEAKDQMIEDLIGVRADLIEELVSAFEDSALELEVDEQTGAIRFSGGVFFDLDDTEVSETGVDYLEQFIPQYIGILLSPQFREQIGQIIVEGHTDTQGSYIYNLNLSQNRALSVVEIILDDDFTDFQHSDVLRSIMTANGRSFSEPIKDDEGEVIADESRRVEFKFRLKDEELIEEIQEMMR